MKWSIAVTAAVVMIAVVVALALGGRSDLDDCAPGSSDPSCAAGGATTSVAAPGTDDIGPTTSTGTSVPSTTGSPVTSAPGVSTSVGAPSPSEPSTTSTTPTTVRPPVQGAEFFEGWDGEPTTPEAWDPSDWMIVSHWRDEENWVNGKTMDAHHSGVNCGEVNAEGTTPARCTSSTNGPRAAIGARTT